MAIEMTKAHAERLKRSCDWDRACKQVNRYINEGTDYFTIEVGGFTVLFSAKQGGDMKIHLVKIIENILVNDKVRAIAYAEQLIKNCEEKYKLTGNIFDKYDIMTARNVLHTLKGEPKEGGVAVCD